MSSILKKKVKDPIMKVLKSGASPESIALAMAFGLTGGLFPVPGTTTLPVMLAIFLFRLNPVAAMLTNYLATPLNIAFVPLFIHYGGKLFGDGDTKAFSVSDFLQDVKSDPVTTLLLFRFTLLHAIAAWLLFMPVATLVLYSILNVVSRRVIAASSKAE